MSYQEPNEDEELDPIEPEGDLQTLIANAMYILEHEKTMPLALHKAATEYLIRLFGRQ